MTGVADNRISSVVILGGGTAGWMAASYLARAFPRLSVTVLESPAVPKIGVGEATIPNLHKVFFGFLGLDEFDWMRECNASFKMGIRFVNWRTDGVGTANARPLGSSIDHHYHLFGLVPVHERLSLPLYWAYQQHAGAAEEVFDYACYAQPPVLDAKRAPRRHDHTPWTTYAWHFDAQLVAAFLARHAVQRLGVMRIEDTMADAVLDQRGFVTGLRTTSGRLVEGDLFVDCSGFRGLLINQVMREPFLDMSDHLLNDSAVAAQVPHDDQEHGVEPYTSAIAMSSGWTWKIPMLGRFGTGYVFSSRFQSRDDATIEFCRMWGINPETHPLNQIRFRVGRNRCAWVRNVASIGLASCFLEPLESTGIYFIYAALYQLVKHCPDKRFDPILIERFNREIEFMFDDCRDFLQIHFRFAPRDDTPFWRAQRDLVLEDAILEKLAMYRAGMPVNEPVVTQDDYYGNFEAEFRQFWPNSSYYCILAGLGVVPDHPFPAMTYREDPMAGARDLFAQIKQQQRELVATLPTHYDYLTQLHHAETESVEARTS